jgi:hypothetical protein
MELIDSSLRRLHGSVSRFTALSATRQEVQFLKAQIELRGLALRDIDAIRGKLLPFIRCRNERLLRRLRDSRMGRSRLGTGRVRRSF